MTGYTTRERPGLEDDIVHVRAKALKVSVKEIFERAYDAAGQGRTAAIIPLHTYSSINGDGKIPDVVQTFCEQPLPTCANPSCPHPGSIGRFTKTSVKGHTSYLCSIGCMDAVENLPEKIESSVQDAEEGMRILERVKIAMSQSVYHEAVPNLIRPLKGQPRTLFTKDGMDNMVTSLNRVGQIIPGIIRRIPRGENGVEYELLDGERRWRGVIEAGIPVYRAMLTEIDDEAAPYVVSVITNFNREGHTTLEQVDAIVKMHEGLKLKLRQIGEIMGLHQVSVSQLYGLRRLTQAVRDLLDPQITPKSQLLPKTAAIDIAQASLSPQRQIEMAQRMIKKELTVFGLKRELSRNVQGVRRVRGSEDLRQSVQSRTQRIKLMLDDLKHLMEQEPTKRAMHEFEPDDRSAVRQSLESSRILLAECEVLFQEERVPLRVA